MSLFHVFYVTCLFFIFRPVRSSSLRFTHLNNVKCRTSTGRYSLAYTRALKSRSFVSCVSKTLYFEGSQRYQNRRCTFAPARLAGQEEQVGSLTQCRIAACLVYCVVRQVQPPRFKAIQDRLMFILRRRSWFSDYHFSVS